MFRILLIDDDILFLEGMKDLLADFRRYISFVECSSIEKSLSVNPGIHFDIIIMDFYFRNSQFNRINGLKAVANHHINTPIVVLTGKDLGDQHIDNVSFETLTKHGAHGLIPKSVTPEKLFCILNLILEGECFFPKPDIGNQFVRTSTLLYKQVNRLTDRQKLILEMACEGNTNRNIADALKISEGTIKAHLSSIYRILEVKNRTQASRKFGEFLIPR